MRAPPRSISAKDRARIAEAIRTAEKKTAGEICCVVARSSGNYFFPPALLLLAAILVASLPLALAFEHWWISIPVPVFVAAQLLAGAAALLAIWAAPLPMRLRFVPRGLRYQRAHDNALKQFLARNIHLTTARTGVLIFVSLAERYAVVVADSGINRHVPQHAWDGVIRDLVDHAGRDQLPEGLVSAVSAVGSLLAQHFPATTDDVNELEDHLVEI